MSESGPIVVNNKYDLCGSLIVLEQFNTIFFNLKFFEGYLNINLQPCSIEEAAIFQWFKLQKQFPTKYIEEYSNLDDIENNKLISVDGASLLEEEKEFYIIFDCDFNRHLYYDNIDYKFAFIQDGYRCLSTLQVIKENSKTYLYSSEFGYLVIGFDSEYQEDCPVFSRDSAHFAFSLVPTKVQGAYCLRSGNQYIQVIRSNSFGSSYLTTDMSAASIFQFIPEY